MALGHEIALAAAIAAGILWIALTLRELLFPPETHVAEICRIAAFAVMVLAGVAAKVLHP